MLCIFSQLAASGGDFFIARWVDIEENYVSIINIQEIIECNRFFKKIREI